MNDYRIRMTFEGNDPIEMTCRPDEDIVTAGLRQGVMIVSDCREGACGACRAFLEDGCYDSLLDHSSYTLSEAEEEEGWVLCCRLQPQSDMELDFEYPVDRVTRVTHSRRTGRIVALEKRGPSVLRLVVRTMTAQAPMTWHPGQYVRLSLCDTGIVRSYSPANTSGGDGDIEFFVRLLPDGACSGALSKMPGPGAMVEVDGAFGGFTLRQGYRKLVFVAGGTGLAPILAMLRHLSQTEPQRKALLIFGASRVEERFAAAELTALKADYSALTIEEAIMDPGPGWAGAPGTAVDCLRQWLERGVGPKEHQYYLCGPEPMIAGAKELLTGRYGVHPNSIFHELFLPSEE